MIVDVAAYGGKLFQRQITILVLLNLMDARTK